MNSFKYAGYPGIVQTEIVRRYDRKSGMTSTPRYKGAVSAINGLSQLLQADKINHQIIDDNGAFATLEVDADDALDGESEENKEETLNITWDMPNAKLEKDLFDKPGIASPDTPSARAVIITEIKTILESIARGDMAVEDVPSDYFGTAVAFAIFELKAAGVEKYQVDAFFLTRTITLSSSYARKWSIQNCNRQFTTDQMITEYKAEENLKCELPDGAWLMQATTFKQEDSGKVTVVESWEHADSWNEYLYAARIPEKVVT